jgi:hypothetical protein
MSTEVHGDGALTLIVTCCLRNSAISRVAEVGHSRAEGIALRAVRRPLEASVAIRSLERDACDLAGLELIEKRTIGSRRRFACCFHFNPDSDEQQHRRYGDEP